MRKLHELIFEKVFFDEENIVHNRFVKKKHGEEYILLFCVGNNFYSFMLKHLKNPRFFSFSWFFNSMHH